MEDIKKLVENPHWVYTRYSPFWNFCLESYEGGPDYSQSLITHQKKASGLFDNLVNFFVNGIPQATASTSMNGNLFMHPKERVEDYNRRVQMSYYYNFNAPIIDIYGDHLFKQAVIVDYKELEPTMKEVGNNVDRQGSSMQEFRKTVSDKAQIYGHIFVVVDSPKLPVQLKTRKEQIENKAFPYLNIYAPQQILNWSLDSNGFPNWVLLKEVYDGNKDFQSFDPDKRLECFYRVWTKTEWYLYGHDYKLIEKGIHPVGEVPIVCIFDKKSNKARNFLGISSLADIAFISRDIYNACSELRQILRDQTFAFLALQGDSKDYSALDLGTGKGLIYPRETNAPQYVSPPSDNAQTYFSHIDRQISKIYQISKLEGGGVSATVKAQPGVVDSQSGASKAWDFNQTNSSLSSKSSNLEDGELKILQIMAKWEGKEFTGNVQYPNEFSVTSLMDDLSEAEKTARLELGRTFDLEVAKAIQKKKFPRKPDAELEKMAKEAEANLERNDKLKDKPSIFGRLNGQFNNKDTATGGQKQGDK